jgi:hypothetical protein
VDYALLACVCGEFCKGAVVYDGNVRAHHDRPAFFQHFSLETVVYLNLRVGRESLNHQVLSADLNTEGGGSRLMPAYRGGGIDDYMASPMNYQPVAIENEPSEALMPKVESV